MNTAQLKQQKLRPLRRSPQELLLMFGTFVDYLGEIIDCVDLLNSEGMDEPEPVMSLRDFHQMLVDLAESRMSLGAIVQSIEGPVERWEEYQQEDSRVQNYGF